MAWIFFIIAALCFALTFSANIPFILTVFLLLTSLGFFLAFVMSFLSSRLESHRRDDTKMISPEDLRLMREQAAARKAATSDKNK